MYPCSVISPYQVESLDRVLLVYYLLKSFSHYTGCIAWALFPCPVSCTLKACTILMIIPGLGPGTILFALVDNVC